jgi:hypothetical protein
MAKTDNEARLAGSLGELRELETFLYALLPAVTQSRPKQGADLLPYIKSQKLKVPASLQGLEITWDGRARITDDDLGVLAPISFVRPGNPDAVGLTIGCIRIGRKIKICLECGWFYCKIVIKGTF